MHELVDITESLATYHRGGEYVNHDGFHMLKHTTDLHRYVEMISLSRPAVLVETGTRTGASALWFSQYVEDVATVDLQPHLRMPDIERRSGGRVRPFEGSSTDEAIVDAVRSFVRGRAALVSLDSSHTRDHVFREIQMYSGLVQPGGFLVVEDGLFDYASPAEWRKFSFGNPALGNPMDAIKELLVDNEEWERAEDIEAMYPVSHHPAGFWRKK